MTIKEFLERLSFLIGNLAIIIKEVIHRVKIISKNLIVSIIIYLDIAIVDSVIGRVERI